MSKTDQAKIGAFLDRGVEAVFPSRDFLEARLKEGKPLSMYLGIDPTGPSLHLGHGIALRKLAAFQELGHKVILLIGDFTGMIGDPTDKSSARVRLTREQVLENAKRYQEQASRYLRFDGENPAELKYNSEWLGKMGFADVVDLASNFTVQQLLERDMFEKRLKDGRPIYVHEFMYPLMQGYDCVAMGVDGEIGGNDQTFNMLAGRTLMKAMEGKEKFVIALRLLVDPTGKKMGKSEGNMITLDDSAVDMYGKVMSWSDGMIVPGLELLTDIPPDEIASIEKEIEGGANPRDAKDRLAREVVAFYHGEDAAATAAEGFVKQFREHENPEDMPELSLDGPMPLVDLLVEAGLAPSKSEARRLIEGGGVKVGGTVAASIQDEVAPAEDGVVVQKGKRGFVRVLKK